MENLQLIENIVKILENLKAKNIVVMDVSKKSKEIKVLIIASFKNEDEVKFVSNEVVERLKFLNLSPIHKDGLTKGQWVVLDYKDILIELFIEQMREKYNLEKLWRDGKNKIISEVKQTRKKATKTNKK